jgi:hypothetical protein
VTAPVLSAAEREVMRMAPVIEALAEAREREGVLREALEFYADLATYDAPSNSRNLSAPIADDNGGRARTALASPTPQETR